MRTAGRLGLAMRRGLRVGSTPAAPTRVWRALVVGAALIAGCGGASPWRELAPPGLSLRFALPCRPDAAERRLTLAGAEVAWRLWACTADGRTFAVGSASMPDALAVGAALEHLGRSAKANVGGRIESEAAAAVRGMTPQPAARRWRLGGRLADGRAVVEDVAVFAYGTRVYQATVVGSAPDAARVQTFFERIEIVP